MNPTLFFCLLFIGVMLCAYQARAAPKFVLASRTPEGGILPYFAYGGACRALYAPDVFASSRPTRRRLSRSERRLAAGRAVIAMVDGDVPVLSKVRTHESDNQVYEELVRTFEGAGSRDQALLQKMRLKSSVPPHHRHLVDRAFAVVYRNT